MKSAQIPSYFWFEYRKIQTRNNSVFGHFSRSGRCDVENETKSDVRFSICKKLKMNNKKNEKIFLTICLSVYNLTTNKNLTFSNSGTYCK